MILTVNVINPDFEQILTDIAATVGMTPQQYATNIVNNFLEAQLRGKYQDDLSKASLTELRTRLGTYSEIKVRAR